ncbi:MAG TPA: hypothetical protein VKQ72_07940 [Aggregatilineales bacterium]|nr:hypothetical protein [Aggregatilineales bacterium]
MAAQEAGVHFLASGRQAFIMNMRLTPAYTGELAIYLNDRLLEKLMLTKGKAQEIAVRMTPKVGTNMIKFDTTPNDTAARPLRLDAFSFQSDTKTGYIITEWQDESS